MENKCVNLGRCGGCTFIFPYFEQKLKKESYIRSLFSDLSFCNPIIVPKILNYRNRMDFLAYQGLCLREKGKYDRFVNVDYCFITEELINSRIKFINELLKNYNDFYDLKTHQGTLRYVVIRTNGLNCQINLVVYKNENYETIANQLAKSFPEDSVYISLNDTFSDVSRGKYIKFLNSEFIEMSYRDIIFKITPNVFFQTNLKGFEFLCEIVENLISELKVKKIVDLFCGIGVFGIIAARKGMKVIGIDIEPENIKIAKINAEINNIDIDFFCEDARKWSKRNSELYDLFILDPPREGLSKEVINMLKISKPLHILYISCNPKTQKQNYNQLSDLYDLVFCQPIDMFPFTNHLENVILLRLK